MSTFDKPLREQPLQRPTTHDIETKIDFVRRSRREDKDAYRTYRVEIPLYAKGEGDEDTKKQFYPGWTREDFEKLEEQLESEGLL